MEEIAPAVLTSNYCRCIMSLNSYSRLVVCVSPMGFGLNNEESTALLLHNYLDKALSKRLCRHLWNRGILEHHYPGADLLAGQPRSSWFYANVMGDVNDGRRKPAAGKQRRALSRRLLPLMSAYVLPSTGLLSSRAAGQSMVLRRLEGQRMKGQRKGGGCWLVCLDKRCQSA